MLAHQAGAVNIPIYYHAKGLSDHTRSLGQFSVKPKPKWKLQRMQNAWCRHPVYIKRFDNRCNAASLGSWSVDEMSIIIKSLMKDVAVHVGDRMFLQHPNGKHSRLLRPSPISKACQSADYKLHIIFVFSLSWPGDTFVWRREGCLN